MPIRAPFEPVSNKIGDKIIANFIFINAANNSEDEINANKIVYINPKFELANDKYNDLLSVISIESSTK